MTANGVVLREGLLLGLGNPLLDIIAVVDQEFLLKYDMKPNNAILADEKHKPMYDEMVEKYKVDYVAGGASQNTMRVAQFILETPHIAGYMGCIGKDKFGEILEAKAKESGVFTRYMYEENEGTGTCAVLITGQERSLCAYLGAANLFQISHVQKAENWALVENALYYYLTGFFLTVSTDTMLLVAQHAKQQNKTVFLNLSAPFLVQYYRQQMMQVMPYVDILFGNETEAGSFGKEHNFGTEDLREIAMKITKLEKLNEKRKRMVVITQGPGPVIVAYDDEIIEYPVPKLTEEEIFDTNGAGDAFAGGFLAKYIQKFPIKICVKCGIYAAVEIIKRSGCTYPSKQCFREEDF
ncbi:hypothetical protein CHUAL_002695 [Chamberlinius hualienensis]